MSVNVIKNFYIMQALRRSCLRGRHVLSNPKFRRHFVHCGYISESRLLAVINQNSNVYRLCVTNVAEPVDILTFEKVCDETLESLTDYFEQIVEEADVLKSGDISYSSGVLTVNLGPQYGTYVINRQTPNRQIWLSSPVSGPKRYDFIAKDNCWIYKHDGQSLHGLLQKEISKLVNIDIDFGQCSYAKV